MKIGFVTCVQLGLSCIESIYDIGGHLDLLVTLNDNKARKKSGRIYLDEFSKKHNVHLLKINHINDIELLNAVKAYKLDWLFIIGWSQIASVEVINAPNIGCIGMHPTLLPIGRGRASIPWAILKGLDKTGVTMFRLDEGVDTGEIIGQIEIQIAVNETATALYEKVDDAHTKLIKKIYPSLLDGSYRLQKQNDKNATYWEGRTPADGEITGIMSVEEVDRIVRATTKPYPGAFFYNQGSKVIIWSGEILDTQIGNPLDITIFNGQYKIESFSIERTEIDK